MAATRAVHIGGDVGSVFTDLWVAGADGTAIAVKTLTGDDPVAAVLRALGLAAEALELGLPELCAAVASFALAGDSAARAAGRLDRTHRPRHHRRLRRHPRDRPGPPCRRRTRRR